MKEEFFGDTTIRHYSDNIVCVTHIEKWQGEDNLAIAKEVTDGMKIYTGTGAPKGLLIIAPSLYKKKEILDHYQRTDINDIARALVIGSFAAKIVGNMYLKLAKNKTNEKGHYVPSKLFTEESKAVEWLNEMVEAHQQKMSNS